MRPVVLMLLAVLALCAAPASALAKESAGAQPTAKTARPGVIRIPSRSSGAAKATPPGARAPGPTLAHPSRPPPLKHNAHKPAARPQPKATPAKPPIKILPRPPAKKR